MGWPVEMSVVGAGGTSYWWSVPKSTGFQAKIAILALLCVVTTVAFWPLIRADFVDFDDPVYVTDEPRIGEGLSWENVVWAFTRPHPAENWQPITTLSYVVDVQAFGPQAFGHHLSNLLIHLANTVLVFLILNWLTGYFWQSAIIAGLFALHPMHVEPVAWISSRKDVLCAFFFLLSIWAYARYARASVKKNDVKENDATEGHAEYRWMWYSGALVFFAAALMSKAMAVTLPFVLLLLDYWPLRRALSGECKREGMVTAGREVRSRRFEVRKFWGLVGEKIPFFVLTAVFSWLASYLLREQGGTQNYGELSFANRAANGMVSYARYLGKLIWPTDLSVFYPRPAYWPMWSVILATLLIAACSIAAVALMRKRPYVFVGWFWFLGTMFPVAGIIYQLGAHSIADRHTYLPYIGLFVLAVFACGEFSLRIGQMLVGAAILVLIALGITARTQVNYWGNSETLFRHALSVDRDNAVAHNHLGSVLLGQGKLKEAEEHFAEALRIRPDYPYAEINYAMALAQQENYEGINVLTNLLKKHPNDQDARYSLGYVLQKKGDVAGAIGEYKEALRLKPDNADALNNLAWIRAANASGSFRSGEEAVRLAERACELTRFHNPLMIGTLAAAYAEAGRFEEAIAAAERAQSVARAHGLQEVVEKNQQLVELYKARRPYHEGE